MATLFTWFPRSAIAPYFPTRLFKLGAEVWGDVGLSVASELGARNTNASVFSDEAEFFFADVLASARAQAGDAHHAQPHGGVRRVPRRRAAARRAVGLTASTGSSTISCGWCFAARCAAVPTSAFHDGLHHREPRRDRRFAGRARRRRLRAGGLRGASRRQRGVPRARRSPVAGAWGYSDGRRHFDCMNPPRGAAAAGAGGGHVGRAHGRRREHQAAAHHRHRIRRRAERARRQDAERFRARGDGGASRREQRLGGAAFAEKMRLMEAEVYGADEAKNAKKKKDKK